MGTATWERWPESEAGSTCWYIRLEWDRNRYEGVWDCYLLGSEMLSLSENEQLEINQLPQFLDVNNFLFMNAHRYLYKVINAISKLYWPDSRKLKNSQVIRLEQKDGSKSGLILTLEIHENKFKIHNCLAREKRTICKSYGFEVSPANTLERS